jgi:signal transduction histidine kinase
MLQSQTSAEQAFESFQSFPLPVYTTDAEGRLTSYNDACVNFAGHVPSLEKDRWCVSWRLADQNGSPIRHDQCPMAVAVQHRRSNRGEIAYAVRPDGTRRKFMPYPTPLFDDRRQFIGAINMLVPEEHFEEAEAYWSEVQLRMHQATLSRSNDAAMAVISHELRQPLAAAENYLTLAKLTLENEGSRESLKRALEGISGVIQRMSTTLDAMRATITKGVLAPRYESLITLIRSAVALSTTYLSVRPQISAKENPIKVLVSGLQIEQVLMNLLKNACEACACRERPFVEIRVYEDQQGFARVDCIDNGTGFPDGWAEELQTGRTSKSNGDGIGLSFASSIVAQHGGRLWVESSSDEGAVVSFTLPIAQAELG